MPGTIVGTIILPWEFYILIELVPIQGIIGSKPDFLKYHVRGLGLQHKNLGKLCVEWGGETQFSTEHLGCFDPSFQFNPSQAHLSGDQNWMCQYVNFSRVVAASC